MKKIFKSIQILHAALTIGSLLFFIVANVINDFQYTQVFGTDSLFVYIVIAFVPMCMFLSRFMNKQALLTYDEGEMEKKLGNYRSRVILRSALVEGAILFAVVTYILSSHMYPIIAFVIGWLFLLWSRPTLEEFQRDYKLTSQEMYDLKAD